MHRGHLRFQQLISTQNIYTISDCCSHIKAIEASNKIWCGPLFIHRSSWSPFTAMQGSHMTTSKDVSSHRHKQPLQVRLQMTKTQHADTNDKHNNKKDPSEEGSVDQLTYYKKLLSCSTYIWTDSILSLCPFLPHSPIHCMRTMHDWKGLVVCRTPLSGMHLTHVLGVWSLDSKLGDLKHDVPDSGL